MMLSIEKLLVKLSAHWPELDKLPFYLKYERNQMDYIRTVIESIGISV